ncbi:MAG TPA: hypothetical protein VG603_11780, partial [Chitinophagales bacterium]|nr:hypothetical protein [Chitinophagales bacterium]
MMKRVLCLGFIVFLFTGLLPAQNHDSRYVDGELYFKVKSTFTDSLTVNSPVMLPLVLLYHMDSCYRPFMGLNNDSLDRTYRIRFTDTAKTERCMDTLQTFPIVDYVEKVPLYTTNFVPNDVNVN